MEFSKSTTEEIVKGIAKEAGVSYHLARRVYYAFSQVIEDKLKEGKEVRIPYIGVFHFVDKKPMVSNLTRQYVPSHKKVKFRILPNIDRYIRVMSREN